MARRAKSPKRQAEPKRSPARKSPKTGNARVRDLEKRLAESLEQQTATSDILSVISSSPNDLEPVLDAVATSAARLCHATDAIIHLVEDQMMRRVKHVGPIPVNPLAALRQITRGTATGRAILDRQVIHVHDMLEEFDRGEYLEARTLQTGFRTVLATPMIVNGLVIGLITLRRTEARPFTTEQINLVKTFANQGAIAIENVRLFNETKEALEQQTATAEILRVISRSQTDVQPVFDTILRSAVQLSGAVMGGIYQFDGTLIHLAGLYGIRSEAVPLHATNFPRPPDRGFIAGRAILDRHVTQMPDANEDTEFQGKEFARTAGWRSSLSAPMLRDGQPIGAISVARAEPGLVPEAIVALLQTFADQAVIAIENVRLFTELQASNRELRTALDTQTATSDILSVISRSQTDVQPVFDTIVTSAGRLLRGNACTLSRIEGDQISLAAMTSIDDAGDASHRARFPMSIHSQEDHAQAVRNRVPLNSTDAHSDPRLPETQQASARLRGYRSLVVVPLVRHDEAIGALGVARPEPGGFTDDEIALLRTFADQAVIAIENVRLFTELQEKNRALTQAHAQVTEALDQQTATSEILRVISSSPTDVQPVFDAIAASATRLCEALNALVTRFDGQLLHIVAYHNVAPERVDALLRAYPRPADRGSVSGRVVLTGAIVHVEDINADPEYTLPLATTVGYRTALGVPMLREGVAIGLILVARDRVSPFSDTQIALLQTFADQAVIAIENARLFKELQARTGELTQSVERLTALGEVSRSVTSTLDVETVLETVVSRARQLAGADGCLIYEYDAGSQQFHSRAADNLDTEYAEALRGVPIRKGEGVSGRAAEVREAVQVADMTQPFAYQSSVRDITIRAGYRAVLSVPLLREDEIIGSLILIRKTPGEFSPEIVELLKTFATQSALAIQNARLFREIADKSAQLEAASRHKSEFLANMSHELRTPLNAIIGFSEVLNERMFGELNEKQDEYLKDIYASGQHLLSLINDILDLSKIEAGRMELEVTDFDLPSAIDNALILVRERATRRGITLGRTIDDRLGIVLGDERKVKQVLLNLLSNALKFTPEGGRIDVRAAMSDGMAEIAVADTGVGIAPEDQEAIFEEFRQVGTADKKVEGTGLGLALSRKFIELHGGRIWVTSEVGKGSTFTFTLPMS